MLKRRETEPEDANFLWVRGVRACVVAEGELSAHELRIAALPLCLPFCNVPTSYVWWVASHSSTIVGDPLEWVVHRLAISVLPFPPILRSSSPRDRWRSCMRDR
jgi:hypothetical protein